MTRSLVFILISCPLSAQFSQFSATDDGQQLYFTSILPLAADPTSFGEPRIFRIAGDGLTPFAQSAAPATQFSRAGATIPQVSGDGKTIGLTRDGHGELLGAGAAVLGPGVLTMSRNARWAVLTVTNVGPPPINSFNAQCTVLNIATGERTTFNFSQPTGAIGMIASDGTVILPGTEGPSLWRQGTSTPITLPGGSTIAALSDDAQILLYNQVLNGSSPKGQRRLVARNLLTGTESIVTTQPYPSTGISVRGLSNDGQLVLYLLVGLNQGAAFVANTTTGQSVALSLPSGEFANDGTLSGNGNIAFLVTTNGHIVSIDAHTGVVTTLVPAPAWVPGIASVPEILFPGSLVHLTGKNLPATADAFAGRMFLDNIALPVIYANSKDIAVQVPWELQPPGPSAFRVDLGDSPFRQNQWVPTNPMFPQFAPLGPGETSVLGFKAVRGDFSGLLTSQPNPGDVIVVYATGLGPVNGPMVTGEPAPVNSTVSIQGQFTCFFYPYGPPAETLFAGLAPGLLGIYQVNFRIPPGPYPGPITGGVCTYSGPGRNGGFSWSVPPPAK